MLYYGSFVRSLGDSPEDVWKSQIREVVRHEFRHHLETRANLFGEDTLIEEDIQSMLRYYMRHGRKEKA